MTNEVSNQIFSYFGFVYTFSEVKLWSIFTAFIFWEKVIEWKIVSL